jgi:hypothetical protein
VQVNWVSSAFAWDATSLCKRHALRRDFAFLQIGYVQHYLQRLNMDIDARR